jgi:tetratricopeptide (TPR) repeat protein
MSKSEQDIEDTRLWHKTFAVETNHLVWSLLGKTARTAQEDEQMVHAAHTSRFHWGEVGMPVNLTRGDWLISHVYVVLNMPQPALDYAKKCLEICKQHTIGDFDLAYAYEAMARAYAALGQKSEGIQYLQLAREAGEQIQNIEPEDREIFFGDFESGPWYGMK